MTENRGSKPGERRGGRQKGTPNKARPPALPAPIVVGGGYRARSPRELYGDLQAAHPKLHPLLLIADIAVDPDNDASVRLQAASTLCKYLFHQLKAVELTGAGEQGAVTLQVVTGIPRDAV